MVYPTLTDNFNLATLNGNFLELYNQMNVAQSYTPTASNLGTITTHTAMVKSGIVRYKLIANSGTWVAGTGYELCVLSAPYRPTVTVWKEILLRTSGGTALYATIIISPGGNVTLYPRSAMSGTQIYIDETYII